jgi:hypothetical protein
MNNEEIANEAIKESLKALLRAVELSERAGYGSQVLGPLTNAQRETQYAYATAAGNN